MIRFVDDGEVFNEINEKRNYYLTEAEQILEKIRVRLANEKRVSVPKKVECWIKGRKIIDTGVRFEDHQSLEEQMKETILSSGWKEASKHQVINQLNEYAQKEREYLVHGKFMEFLKRFDEVLGSPDMLPFPLLLNIEKSKELFEGVIVNIQTGFYSELEQIIASVREAYIVVIDEVYHEMVLSDEMNRAHEVEDFLKVRTITWLGNADNFSRFKNYVVAYYGSVIKARIDALYPRFKPYQHMEHQLFFDQVKVLGFDQVYDYHRDLIAQFYKKYDHVLFEGFSIQTDDLVVSLIISPVLQDFEKRIEKDLKNYKKKQADENNEDAGSDES